MTTATRPCERRCIQCEQWLHHSRFRTKTYRTAHNTVRSFEPRCKGCEQINRNLAKNADRATATINSRAATAARKAGVTRAFVMTNLNYRALIPHLRAMMTDEGLCTSCGHPFLNGADIQLEHREPPRHRQDWSRLHARNMGIACASCNRTKGHMPYAEWLDAQEAARLANEADHRTLTLATIPTTGIQPLLPFE